MGIAGSLIVSRLMATFLFEVGALDVAALLSALAVLFIAAVAAAVIPAVASARRSPAGLLREA
jgi:hypothetical protein